MRKNNGCLIFILIILAIAGVSWVRYYAIPIIVIFIVIAVVNGKKTSEARKEDRTAGKEKENDRTGKETEQSEYRNAEYARTDHTGPKASDTIITCEYCGSQIDTSQHSTCPHCGGPYWDNEQWKEVWKRKMSR